MPLKQNKTHLYSWLQFQKLTPFNYKTKEKMILKISVVFIDTVIVNDSSKSKMCITKTKQIQNSILIILNLEHICQWTIKWDYMNETIIFILEKDR